MQNAYSTGGGDATGGEGFKPAFVAFVGVTSASETIKAYGEVWLQITLAFSNPAPPTMKAQTISDPEFSKEKWITLPTDVKKSLILGAYSTYFYTLNATNVIDGLLVADYGNTVPLDISINPCMFSDSLPPKKNVDSDKYGVLWTWNKDAKPPAFESNPIPDSKIMTVYNIAETVLKNTLKTVYGELVTDAQPVHITDAMKQRIVQAVKIADDEFNRAYQPSVLTDTDMKPIAQPTILTDGDMKPVSQAVKITDEDFNRINAPVIINDKSMNPVYDVKGNWSRIPVAVLDDANYNITNPDAQPVITNVTNNVMIQKIIEDVVVSKIKDPVQVQKVIDDVNVIIKDQPIETFQKKSTWDILMMVIGTVIRAEQEQAALNNLKDLDINKPNAENDSSDNHNSGEDQ